MEDKINNLFKIDPNKILPSFYSFEISDNESIKVHKDVSGSKILNLEKVKYSLPFWESKYYYQLLEKHLVNQNKEQLVLDAGCGDGRFTLFLIKLGFKNIIASDSNIDSLMALYSVLENEGHLDKVTVVHNNVSELPFVDNVFDITLCIGVLYYLNEDYEKGLNEIYRCMKPNGYLMETEPDKEGNAIKALLFDGIETFIDVSNNNRFLEFFDGKPISLRCFSEQEMIETYNKKGLEILDKKAISLFPSLLTIANKKGNISDGNKIDVYEEHLQKAFKYYYDQDSNIAKHKLWVTMKK